MRSKKFKTSGLKPGDKVFMIDCLEAEKYQGVTWVVRSEPWECCGAEIVLLEGKAGGFDTARLRKIGGRV